MAMSKIDDLTPEEIRDIKEYRKSNKGKKSSTLSELLDELNR